MSLSASLSGWAAPSLTPQPLPLRALPPLLHLHSAPPSLSLSFSIPPFLLYRPHLLSMFFSNAGGAADGRTDGRAEIERWEMAADNGLARRRR